MDKRGSLNHITNWDTFRVAVIEEFGSINIFGREVNQLFDLLPRYESVQEVAQDLAPKIKTLQSNLVTMAEFHKLEHLHSIIITQSLIQNSMRFRFPLEAKPSFNDQFTMFREQSPDNILAPNTFSFLAQFVNKLKKSYQSNPSLYDLDSTPSSIGVKLVRYGPPNSKSKPHHSIGDFNEPPRRPCSLCTIKGFQADHYPLNMHCGVAELSSPDILKLISDYHLCPSCTQAHDPAYKCKLTYRNGDSKVCSKGCLMDAFPVHRRACMNNYQALSVTVSQVSMGRSIPLVKNILMGELVMGIQYDTGCQLSLISHSTLSFLLPSMYSLGLSSRVRVLSYAGEGKDILTTEVKLRLHG